ncbi:MAG: hypothetical protein L0228_11715 [Planctomycetes bacterium]|nr:hypothetical protein [Planctomycetota bacterium]
MGHNLVGRFDVANMKYNLIGTGSIIYDLDGSSAALDSTNFTGTTADSPQLGSLSNNGGPTPTHSLMNDSPAIDKGSNALASDPLSGNLFTSDQRGAPFTRPWDITSIANVSPGNFVDIGAYEIGLPKVIEVIVSDSVPPAHTPYSFATAVGSGEQIRTVPVGGANRVQVRFSEVVTISASHVTVQNANAGTFFAGNLSLSGTTATWTLNAGVFFRGQIILRVDDGVSGLGGFLDGEWTNPTSLSSAGTSVFPSGDGTAGGYFQFYFTVLSGDYNRTNIVDAADWVLWKKFNGTTSGALFWMGDANGDGAVNQADEYIRTSMFGVDYTQWPT